MGLGATQVTLRRFHHENTEITKFFFAVSHRCARGTNGVSKKNLCVLCAFVVNTP